MREIKFRAWDKDSCVWQRVFNITSDGRFTIGNGCDYSNKIILMQYTGLKDKNGKEIYEGDILKFNTKGGNEMVYEVKWKGKGFKPTRMSEDNQEEIEIIGNIYENKELLERL